MKSLWLVQESEEYGAGHFTHAICSTKEKAQVVRDWYERDEVYIQEKKLDSHTALFDRRKEERRKG